MNRGIRLRQGQKLNASFSSEVAGGLVMIFFLLIVRAVDNTAFNRLRVVIVIRQVLFSVSRFSVNTCSEASF